MNEKKRTETIIEALTDKIELLKNEMWIKEFENEQLKKENAKLNEFLNPTKKVGEKDE